MLIVPADSRYTAGRLALATWFLVAANTLAFVLVSSHDARVTAQALDYYAQSGLAQYEFPLYLDTLHERGDDRTAERLQQGLAAAAPEQRQALQDRVMLADVEFQEALDRGQLVTPEQPFYAAWKAQRAGLSEITAHDWTVHAALRADRLRPWTFFTYQFLHGGWGHLFGNMLMLVLVGRLIESAVGAWRYLVVYLVGGALAGAAFVAVHSGRALPLVGASGAIAAVMGLFAVAFARRRVRFFYAFLGFVGFASLPALWLLPYWIGWELLQLFLAKGSPVAYEAHVGGLAAGALAALLLHRLPGDAETQARLDAPEQERRFEDELQEAGQLAARLHVERARSLLEQLHRQRPNDARPLQKLYALARMAPDSPEFHAIAARVLSIPAADPAMRALAADVRGDYLRSARPAPALPPPLLVELFEHAAMRGDTAGADRLLKPLLAGAPGDNRVHRGLLRLAQSAPADKARAYRALAARHFA